MHVGRGDRVEARIFKRELLASTLDELPRSDGRRVGLEPLPQVLLHVWARFGDDQLRDRGRVVRQIQSAARSDLKRPPARLPDQLPPRLTLPGALREPAHDRVIEGEQPLVEPEGISHSGDFMRVIRLRPLDSDSVTAAQ